MQNTKKGNTDNNKLSDSQDVKSPTVIIDPTPFTAEEKLMILRANLNPINPFDLPVGS